MVILVEVLSSILAMLVQPVVHSLFSVRGEPVGWGRLGFLGGCVEGFRGRGVPEGVFWHGSGWWWVSWLQRAWLLAEYLVLQFRS